MFLRLRSSGFMGPKLPFGSFWIWKTFAPSPPRPSSMKRRRPVIIAIAAQTRPTPMTMPSKVSPARSLCPRNAPTARRASSPRARIVRRKPGRRCAGSDAIGRGRVDSLIPERLDGIERCRAPRRPQTEDEAYRGGEADAREHDPRVHAGGERRHHRHHVRAAEPDGGAEEAADAAHHHCLAKELEENGQLPGAERAADADLPRPLLHGDEQDVHHPDAPDERGDEADDVDDELHVARHVAEHVEHPVLAIDREVVVLVRGEPAVVADDRHDLVLRLGDLSGGSDDGDGHPALLPEGTQERREREHDQHVLRLTKGVSLPDERSDHRAAPDGTDAKLLPCRILIREEGVLDVGADHAGVATDLVIDVADEPAAFDLPASGLEEALGGAADEDVLEILPALADDALGTGDGRDGQRQRRETLDGVPVALPDRGAVAVLPPVVAVDDPRTRAHVQRVRAQRGELAAEGLVEAHRRGRDRDDGGDADGDAQDRERCAKPVHEQAAQRLHHGVTQLAEEAEEGAEEPDLTRGSLPGKAERCFAHGRPSTAFWAAWNAASASAPRASALAYATSRPRPSAPTRRSTSRTARGQRAASFGSCVTRMMVLPFSCRSRKRCTISSPVLLSRFPVGSSARRSEGSVTSARAMATRWRWPPDSSAGLCFMRSLSCTISRACSAASRLSFLERPR